MTRYAAVLLGLPWSGSAHAKDIWTTPEWEKREKIAASLWGVTCTAQGADYLKRLAPEPDRVTLAYHGLDFSRFPPHARETTSRDGSDAANPVRILSVGRAVAKRPTAKIPPEIEVFQLQLRARLVVSGEQRQVCFVAMGERVEQLANARHDAEARPAVGNFRREMAQVHVGEAREG